MNKKQRKEIDAIRGKLDDVLQEIEDIKAEEEGDECKHDSAACPAHQPW
ncbi:MAG TPA: hypothetical protein VFB72_11085 [Verrucomicrobiae bacterium]|nr:hypothetical protein [Verrucomicrobiae bacterium]